MIDHQMSQQVFGRRITIERLIPCQTETLSAVIQQLGQQHGGHLFTAILHTEPLITDIEAAAGTEYRLQKEVTIILPPRAIAPASGHGDKVKAHGRQAAGVNPIVHPQQADLAKGNGAHGHQGTEVDLTGEKTLAAPLARESLFHQLDKEIRADEPGKSGLVQPLLPAHQQAAHQLQHPLILLVGKIELLEQQQHPLPPDPGLGLLG